MDEGMMDSLEYLVIDDTANRHDFDDLAAFEASLDPKATKELEQRAAVILGIDGFAAA